MKKLLNPYAIALMLFLCGTGFLAFTGLSEDKVYFSDVAQALEFSKNEQQTARLFGTVKNSDIRTVDAKQTVRFLLEDQTNKNLTLEVVYAGFPPDSFADGAEVIVEGKFAPGHTHFNARTLMTKCPSKYEKENRVKTSG